MMVYQERIDPPEPLPASESSDVLQMQRTIDTLQQENTWLKVQLVRVVRAIGKAAFGGGIDKDQRCTRFENYRRSK